MKIVFSLDSLHFRGTELQAFGKGGFFDFYFFFEMDASYLQIIAQVPRNENRGMQNSNIVKFPLSKVGYAHSQAKRTQEDIFDCSSLVARTCSAQRTPLS